MALYVHEGSLHQEPVPVNEVGIVIPPIWQPCSGHEDSRTGEIYECVVDQNHLHFDINELKYGFRPALSAYFREQNHLTVWMHRCRHEEWHAKHQKFVPLPEEEIMMQAMEEVNTLKDVDRAYHALQSAENNLFFDGSGFALYNEPVPLEELLERRSRYIEERDMCLKEIADFEVLPFELVTGALVLTAPLEAQRRLKVNPVYAMTANLRGSNKNKAFNKRQLDLLEYLDQREVLARAA